MGGSMSQEQIDALLGGDAGGNNDKPATSAASSNGNGNISPDNNIPQGEDIPDEVGLGLLGEIYNISMGAAAKAVASLIKMKVDISTPDVKVMPKEHLIFKTLEPAVGVKINYVEGIIGENIFILSQLDIMKLVDIVIGGTGDIDESSEFNEMHLSAIGEIMNQMMGASSVNVADFLSLKIDISVPESFKIEGQFPIDTDETDKGLIVATKFKFVVGDIINSEMITTCSMDFAKDLIHRAMVNFGMLPVDTPPVVETMTVDTTPPPVQPEPAAPPPVQQQPAPVVEVQPEPLPQPTPQPQTPPQQQQQIPVSPPPVQQQYPPMQTPGFDPNQMYAMFAQQQQQMQQLLVNLTEKLISQPQAQGQMMQTTSQQPANVNAQSASFRSFDTSADEIIPYDNMDLVLDLPLDVAIEIGRTKKTVNEVLELGEGAIIQLDKESSEPVDIWINGNLVAKGTVVVIEENFAVRITEIVSPQDKLKAARSRKEK